MKPNNDSDLGAKIPQGAGNAQMMTQAAYQAWDRANQMGVEHGMVVLQIQRLNTHTDQMNIRLRDAENSLNSITSAGFWKRLKWLIIGGAMCLLLSTQAQAELRFIGIRAVGQDIYLSIDADRAWILEWSPDLVRWREIWRNPGPPPGGQQYFVGKDPGAAAHAFVRGFYRLRAQ